MIGPNMSLSTFFDGGASTLGVFYPTHCLAAIFPNLEVAERAADRLLLAGFSRGDVVSASGSEVLEFDRDMITVGHLIMRALSRFFTTSQSFSDHDLKDARRGAGFWWCGARTIKPCKRRGLSSSQKPRGTPAITDAAESSIWRAIPTRTSPLLYGTGY